jgi:sugar lactone lactonase YvrE
MSHSKNVLVGRRSLVLGSSLIMAVLSVGCAGATPRVRLQSSANRVSISQPSLYPETLQANPLTGGFLVSSLREGAVYDVKLDGSVKKLVHDDRLTSILGIAVDAKAGRLYVTNADVGAGVRHSSRGAKKEAGVGIYDLSTGALQRYVDLAPLVPEGEHLVNGITVDDRGNAYVTDSFSPVIYKIDAAGTASVLLTDEEFKGKAVNLNGIVYHPSGVLLVIKKSTGTLYRIPLDSPKSFERVNVPGAFAGGDGLMLVGRSELVLVANKTPAAAANAAFVLRTDDDWRSAKVVETAALGDGYPTTSANVGGRVYVLTSHLDELLGATEQTRDGIMQKGRRAEIREVGTISGDAHSVRSGK